MKKKLMDGIKKIVDLSDMRESKIISILDDLLVETINFLTSELNKKPYVNHRSISIGKLEEKFGTDYGIKRTNDSVTFGDWLFSLRPFTLSNILVFLIVKESFMHFIELPLTIVEETIINFLTILWIQKYFKIYNIENPLIVTINRNIYPETIAGKAHHYFVSLLELLFRKKIDFKVVFEKFLEIRKDTKGSEVETSNAFNKWVNDTTIKDIDAIVPMIVSKNIIPIIEYLIDTGYEDSRTSDMAKILSKHENTIRKAIRKVSSLYYTYWKANINYEKIKLHNYFLKINFESNSAFNQIQDMLLKIPYLKSLYKGSSDEYDFIYSPSLICPHIIAETIKENLVKFERKNQIKDFNLQLIREKYHFATLTSSNNEFLTNPNVTTLKKLLSDNHSDLQLNKYIFSHYVRDNSPVIEDEIPLDYNLLFFLSFLSLKYLLSGSYGGKVHEIPKLYERNNISSTNIQECIDFLNQIEIRARRRDVLSFSLFLCGPTKNRDVLIFETPLLGSEKNTREIIDKIRVFAFLVKFTLHNRLVFVLPGISHEHQVKSYIKNTLEKEGIKPIFSTVNLIKSKFVPLHDLYDYDNQKWKL
jgi:hypothetical protein